MCQTFLNSISFTAAADYIRNSSNLDFLAASEQQWPQHLTSAQRGSGRVSTSFHKTRGSYHLVTHVHYLSSCVSMKTKHSSECILTDGLWAVYFIAQDEDWDI